MYLRRVIPLKGKWVFPLWLFSLGLFSNILAQDFCNGENVEFIFSDIDACVGDNVCISVTTNNFENVTAFQFSINFNPITVQYTGCQNPGNLQTFTCNSIIGTSAAEGILRVLWFESNASPINLPDSTVLFQLCYDIIGDPGPSNPIVITDNPVSIEIVTDENGTSSRQDSVCIKGGGINVCCQDYSIHYSACSAPDGVSAGSLTIFVCGGNAPYSYDFNGQMGVLNADNEELTFTDLLPGIYPISVTDDLGTVVEDSLEITTGNPLVLDFSTIASPTCAIQRFPNGRIVASPSGGQSPYSFTWSTTPANIPQISQLESGDYSVTVQDAYGCRLDSTLTLFRDTLRIEAEIADSALCLGSTRGGRLRLRASGGTQFPAGGYNICASFESGGNICTGQPDTNLFLINVPAGSVSYRVIDGSVPVNQCTTETQFVEMPFRKTLELEVDPIDISCFGLGDGRAIVDITALNGSQRGPYTFELTDINDNFLEGVNVPNPTYQFSSLETNNFILKAEDGDDCIVSDTFEILEPPALELDTSNVVSPECVGNGNNGVIELDGIGGTGTLSYSWDDGSTEEDRLDLGQGFYSVTVSDENNCQDSLSVELLLPDAITIDSVNLQHVSCSGQADGSMAIYIAGNDPTITFDWGSGPIDDNVFMDVPAGDYTIRIENSAGCYMDTSLTILPAEPIQATGTMDIPTCPGGLGNIGVVAFGGAGNYTYQWFGQNQTESVLPQVPAGDYTVRVTDENGCGEDFTITLQDPDAIDLVVDQIIHISCSDIKNGRALATATGGTDTLGIYNYIWSSGESDIGISHNANALPQGDQWVIASDGICASDTVFFEIQAPEPLTIDIIRSVINPPACFGSNDGSIDLIASGGVGPYSFTWPDYNFTGPNISDVAAGTLRVEIRDFNNCTTIDSIVLPNPDLFSVAIDSSSVVNLNCFGDNIGQITVGHSGGNAGIFTYQWTNNVSDGTVASNLGPGTYAVTVTDSRGCSGTAEYELTASSEIVADIPIPEDPNCFGGQTCISVNSASGGSGPNYRFSVNNGPLFPIDTCVNVFAGGYNVKVFDRDGCSVETNFTIDQPEEISVELGPDIDLDLGGTGEITATVSSGAAIDSVFWSPIDELQCLNSNCSQVLASPTTDATYQVFILDVNGCTALDEITLRVKTNRNVYVPNVFRPVPYNGSGNNSTFKIQTGPGASLVEFFRVYNRLGNMMHSEENIVVDTPNVGQWDGTFNGQLLKPGVYVYVARVLFVDGQREVYKGTITLIR